MSDRRWRYYAFRNFVISMNEPIIRFLRRRLLDYVPCDPLSKSDYFMEFFKYLKSSLHRLNNLPSSQFLFFFYPQMHSSSNKYEKGQV